MSIKQKHPPGLSIIEVIVAIAILIIISASTISTILGAFSTNRLAQEETQATYIATQGLDAVKSISSQDWANLSPGTYGLTNSSGTWAFSGSSDTSGKFTRTITITAINRDTGGNIVTSGGFTDPQSFSIQASITWNFTPTRSNTISLNQLLTQWSATDQTSVSGGVTTCTQYCLSLSNTSGSCRENTTQCGNHSETYQSAGDTYCTGGPSADTCCCLP